MAQVDDLLVDGVPVRRYGPVDTEGQGLVFFHGGGWVLGSIETHDRQCRELAAGSGAVVLSADYRLAPEHRFPAAFDDALSVTTALLGDGAEFGVDAQRLGVAGDSAGANLATAVALARRDLAAKAGGPALRAQLLIYPAVDATMSAASHIENEHGPFLSRAEMAWFYQHYQGDAPAKDWRLSPLHAADHHGLPPALVVTAELDPLRDEGEIYANTLAAAGVEAAAVRYAGTSHGFFSWTDKAEPSRQAMAQSVAWLRSRL